VAEVAAGQRPVGAPLEVLSVFLKLGVSCFGAPTAHIGYFRKEFHRLVVCQSEICALDVGVVQEFLGGIGERNSPSFEDISRICKNRDCG
jgi:hypothetical protein